MNPYVLLKVLKRVLRSVAKRVQASCMKMTPGHMSI